MEFDLGSVKQNIYPSYTLLQNPTSTLIQKIDIAYGLCQDLVDWLFRDPLKRKPFKTGDRGSNQLWAP